MDLFSAVSFQMISLGRGGLFNILKKAADIQTALFEPAGGHFECEFCWLRGAMGVLGLGQHFSDIDESSLFIQKGDGKWNERVTHPHAVDGRLRKNKQHAVIARQAFAVHQTLGA